MKIRLLIAAAENGYAEHLSGVLTEKYAEIFEVGVCSSPDRLKDSLLAGRYDVALTEPEFVTAIDPDSVTLPLLLADGSDIAGDIGLKKIKKYQRISSIAGNILEIYAETGKKANGCGVKKARVTVSWSPSGGAGKTAAALAVSANRALSGKQAVYLNLENFASTPLYFQEKGKSISKVFEKLESNVSMFLTGIRQKDEDSGIFYFRGPENYEDINILTAEDIETLVSACAEGADELIVDLSSQCDERTQKVFELADTILLVADHSAAAYIKLSQFINQHNIFGRLQHKIVLVNNKGSKITEPKINKTIYLPLVQPDDPILIVKTLSGGNFDFD